MKHAIVFDDPSLPLFQGRGIPVVSGQLEKPFLPQEGLFLKDGHAIEKPSIVKPPKGLYQRKWFLYADVCPFYNSERACDVHEDPRRPTVCKNYPITLFGGNYSEGGFFDLKVKDSCEYSERIKTEITKEFPRVKIID
jgi:Fe-S-cluster containining protein